MDRLRARLVDLLRRRRAVTERAAAVRALDGECARAAHEARVAAARARALACRLAERAQREGARAAIVAALLATERAAARHEARMASGWRSGGEPPLLH
ncbi:MAG TPA: hypothetical protein VIN04_06450 [Myxococcota bacterium]